MRYAIINIETGEVVNVAEWDGSSDWSPDEGFIAVSSENAAPGWTYGEGGFVPPPDQA